MLARLPHAWLRQPLFEFPSPPNSTICDPNLAKISALLDLLFCLADPFSLTCRDHLQEGCIQLTLVQHFMLFAPLIIRQDGISSSTKGGRIRSGGRQTAALRTRSVSPPLAPLLDEARLTYHPSPGVSTTTEAAQIYQSRRSELQGIASKIGELEGEADEHK